MAEEIKTKICPSCGNPDCLEEDAFCFMCGACLTNYCSNDECPLNCDDDGRSELPASHRYCPECGAETTFKKQGYFDKH